MLSVNHQVMPYVLFNGWLCKSPPEKKMKRSIKLFRSQWKKRFFVLHQTTEMYELNYYKNEHSTKKKGSINLQLCNQVIESVHSDFFPNLLALKTWHRNKVRTYYLAASSQAEMKEWVHWVCFVCGINTPPLETHTLELNPILDNHSLGQSAGPSVESRSEGVSGRPRRCSRVFSRELDNVHLTAFQQESVPEEMSKQDGVTPLEVEDTLFQSFIKQLSESLSLAEPDFEDTEQQFAAFKQASPVKETLEGEVLQRKSIHAIEMTHSTEQVPTEAVVLLPQEGEINTESAYLSEDRGDVPDLICTLQPQPKMYRVSTGYDMPNSSISKLNKQSPNCSPSPVAH